MRNIKGIWHPYCSSSWSHELGYTICKYFGFKKLVRLETVDLHEFRYMRESQLPDHEDEEEYPVQFYENQYGEFAPYAYNENSQSCTVAFIECDNTY